MDEKGYRLWRHLMLLGEKTGCHQRPDRSYFFRGYQMPVCARCSGVILGYLIAVPSFFLLGISKSLSLVGCLIMFIDWLLQALRIRTSTNPRRLFTGMLGGFGMMSMQLYLIKVISSFTAAHIIKR